MGRMRRWRGLRRWGGCGDGEDKMIERMRRRKSRNVFQLFSSVAHRSYTGTKHLKKLVCSAEDVGLMINLVLL